MKIIKLYLATFLMAVINVSCNYQEITTKSLLEEMIDRDVLASFPDPYYTCKQFSSYDRQSVEADKPGWFANWDRSQFVREENKEGRRELVMFDADGPGAVVRFWVTVSRYKGNGILRIYIDGAKEPVVEGEVLDLISGGAFTGAPLSTSVSDLTEYLKRGHNLYLPIPYSRHCKITYESPDVIVNGKKEGERFYYNINYRTWVKGVRVRSFRKDDLTQYASDIEHVQKLLSKREHRLIPDNILTEKKNIKLDPDGEMVIRLSGPQAIRYLQVRLKAENEAQALRSTVLICRFDKEQTVWCPMGDFFGCGYRLSSFSTWYNKVSGKDMSSFWVMPFAESCEIVIKNYGKQVVEIENLHVQTNKWDWDKRSMHFGAGWFEQYHLDTGTDQRNYEGVGDMFDVNYVTLTGKGLLVGNGVTLFNATDDWWGEGDEKIYIDGETFPSHFGTGSEDFYGYAWCMPNVFDHPFIAQPIGDGAITPGYVTNMRYRSLDAIPFGEKLVFDMEMWHSKHAIINHAPVSYWYMLPNGKTNLKGDPSQVQNPVALSMEDMELKQ